MQIPLIDRIRFKHAVLFSTAIFVMQQIEHTDTAFSALFCGYILLSTLAFNLAGGFTYPSGWFIFFNASLTAILGLTYKVLLGEQGDTHLHAPATTMLAYCLGMAMTIFAVFLTRKLRPKTGLLAGMGEGENMKKAALGAFLLGGAVQLLSYSPTEGGSFLSAVRQINYFTQLGVLLGTFYEVKTSNGTRSTNWIVWTAGVVMFIQGGILGFSKFGALLSAVTWLATAIVAGHNFSRKQVVVVVLWFVFFQMYLVPYSQIGRNLRVEDATPLDDAKTAASLLGRLPELRAEFLEQEGEQTSDDDSKPHLYDSGQGFFDRLNMLGPDDLLIAYTMDGNEEGLMPTWLAFFNVVPHFLWKDKPFYYPGNLYAREIGMIAEDNEGTGISFSPTGDAFHQAGFFGVAILVPSILFLLFIVMDSLSGDVRKAPWGILFCVLVTHSAPEGMLGGQVYVFTYGAFGIAVVALLAKYLLPILSGVITNTERTRVRKTIDFQPVVRPRSRPLGIESGPAPENS